jgi:hypothetical protein
MEFVRVCLRRDEKLRGDGWTCVSAEIRVIWVVPPCMWPQSAKVLEEPPVPH